jgi:hypothetical protein
VDQQEDWVPSIGAADRHPLLDSANPHFLEPFDAGRIHDFASFRDYTDRLVSA